MNKVDKKKQTPLSYAMKQGKDSIVQLLTSYGAKLPEKNDKKSKSGKKRTEEKEESEKAETTPTTYSLYKIENDKLIPLSNAELDEFFKAHHAIADLMENPEKLEKLEFEASNE